jgi:hypothetical protein
MRNVLSGVLDGVVEENSREGIILGVAKQASPIAKMPRCQAVDTRIKAQAKEACIWIGNVCRFQYLYKLCRTPESSVDVMRDEKSSRLLGFSSLFQHVTALPFMVD